MKPYYTDDFCTIYHGDCREVLPSLSGIGIIADPPYGVNWDTDYTRFSSGFSTTRYARKPVANDAVPFDPSFLLDFPFVITWGANCYCRHLPTGSWLVWDKRHKNGTAFLADAELAFMNKGHGVYIFKQTQQGCLRPEPILHPTQKPEGLMRWCVEKCPPPLVVCDPFMGSGTTLRAAKDLGRQAIGIELEEQYCEIAANRLSQSVLQLQPTPQHSNTP